MVMHRIYGKAQLNNSANKWGALAIGAPVSLLHSQSRAPGLQPRLAQWLMRPWLQDLNIVAHHTLQDIIKIIMPDGAPHVISRSSASAMFTYVS